MSLFGCCIRKVVDVRTLDYRHSGISQVPAAVFNAERSIEELHLDSNQIKVLPRELFHCHGLRILTFSDNEITTMPAAVSSLTNLEKLDVSKNGILELPENLKTLKYLAILDASVNPLGKLPDGFTQLLNLTQVCLNDCFLEYVPGNFGRLSQLKILELRENHLKTLPQSLSRLTELERLDVGCNEFTELPGNVIATMLNLLELWCDSNQITNVPKEIGNLKQLMYFDACKNRITDLPDEIDGCISLSDLHLSTNLLKTLPHSIGRLSNITTLKVDDNQLVSLPSSIGGLVSLSEFDVSANDLEEIPPTIGLLRHLRTLIADENFLADIPCELGSCSGLTVLSVRSNKLTYLPDEIGRIPRLRVLNLSDNEIKVLPYSLMNLKELQALWLAENQSKALIRLQAATDPETKRKCLTCYLLPQQRMDPIDSYGDDNQSFHPSLWEEQRLERLQIQFQDTGQYDANAGSAYPKEMRVRTRHLQNEAMRKTTGGTEANDAEDCVELSENGLLLGPTPGSPKTSTHRLVKLEKEKVAKDKAKINRHSQEISSQDVQLLVSSKHDPHTSQDQTRHSHRSKDRINSKLSEKDFELEPVTSTSSSKLNSSSFTSANTHNKPKTIQNGHYHASNSARSLNESRQVSGRTSVKQSQSYTDTPQVEYSSHQSLKGQPYDRYLTSQLQLQVTADSTDGQSAETRSRVSNSRLSAANPSSQTVVNQEDTFGVFTSDEDPKLYQRRFKYYQRMRKHRKNPEVQSDLGYYHGQYNGLSKPSAAASDSGHRLRRPLQQGHDGFDQWERYSQRSVGDGYASDVEGFNYGGKRMHHVANNMKSPYRPTHKTLAGSRGSVNEKRPAVPPSYNTAMAKRSESKQLENTSFPPPPPYKPPARDPGPDGASNDGVPRSSPIHENVAELENVPFKSYGNEKLQKVNGTMVNVTANPIASIYQAVSSTPLTPSQSHRPNLMGVLTNNNPESSHTSSNYYSPIENYRNAPVRRSNSNSARPDNEFRKHPQSQQSATQRSSFYNSNLVQDDGPADTEYAAQISKSLGRLGYNRESDKKLGRPSSQYGTDVNDTVPPPAPFSSSHNDNPATRNNTSELYAVVGKANLGMNDSSNYATPKYDNSVNMRSSQQRHSQRHSYHHPSNGHIPSSQSNKHTSNYSYLPPPSRKSPKLAHKQIVATGLEVEQATNDQIIQVSITKNPGLGFSVAGGVGLQGNPYKPQDEGIFVTKLHSKAAANILHPGDKILAVNGIDFAHMEHNSAVNILKQQPTYVNMTIERTLLPTDV